MSNAESATSALFASRGVLGCRRPVSEVILRVTQAGLVGMAALGVVDVLVARRTKARYFFLHAIINFVIAALSFQDVIYVFSDPLSALASTEVSHWPSSLVFSIHVYHVAFFSNLQWIDWLHHILMVAVGAPLLITGEVGPLMNFNNAFMCGVPGGLDYILLFCVKEGWMKPLMEKRFNSMINVWMRAPFLVCTGTLVLVQHHVQLGSGVPSYVIYTRLFLSLLACWNALFFMERVVGNYHVNEYKAKLKRQADRAAALARQPSLLEGPYDTEEHVGPGLFMPKTISHKDLQELAAEAAKTANGPKHE